MPVLSAPVKNKPSNRGSRANRALSQIRVSSVISVASAPSMHKEIVRRFKNRNPIVMAFGILGKTFSDTIAGRVVTHGTLVKK